jgi:hypothetical protein
MELGLGARGEGTRVASAPLVNTGVLRFAQNDNVKQTTTIATTITTATATATTTATTGPSTAPLAMRLREASLRMTLYRDREQQIPFGDDNKKATATATTATLL